MSALLKPTKVLGRAIMTRGGLVVEECFQFGVFDVLCCRPECFWGDGFEGGDYGVADCADVVASLALVLALRDDGNIAFKKRPHRVAVVAVREKLPGAP